MSFNVSSIKGLRIEALNLGPGEEPYYPPYDYKFLVTNRSAKSDWFQKWPWLHYDAARDKVFCHFCSKAFKQKLLLNNKTELAYTEKAFATTTFNTYQNSQCLIESVEKVGKNSSQKDIDEVLSKEHESEKEKARH